LVNIPHTLGGTLGLLLLLMDDLFGLTDGLSPPNLVQKSSGPTFVPPWVVKAKLSPVLSMDILFFEVTSLTTVGVFSAFIFAG